MTNEQLKEVESWYNDLLRMTLKAAFDAERSNSNHKWALLACYDGVKGYHKTAGEVFKIDAYTGVYCGVEKILQRMLREMGMEAYL